MRAVLCIAAFAAFSCAETKRTNELQQRFLRAPFGACFHRPHTEQIILLIYSAHEQSILLIFYSA
jgi:hypothetical protein